MRELQIGINANYYLSNVNRINLEYGIISPPPLFLSPFTGDVLNLRFEEKKQSVEFVGLVMHIYNRRINGDFCGLMTFFLLLQSKDAKELIDKYIPLGGARGEPDDFK